MYADDTTLFLGWDENIYAVECVLEVFSDATGARVNRKSQRVRFVPGWSKHFGGYLLERIQHPKELGHCLQEAASQARELGKRDFSLSGRVGAANANLLADLNHVAFVFPILFVMGRFVCDMRAGCPRKNVHRMGKRRKGRSLCPS